MCDVLSYNELDSLHVERNRNQCVVWCIHTHDSIVAPHDSLPPSRWAALRERKVSGWRSVDTCGRWAGWQGTKWWTWWTRWRVEDDRGAWWMSRQDERTWCGYLPFVLILIEPYLVKRKILGMICLNTHRHAQHCIRAKSPVSAVLNHPFQDHSWPFLWTNECDHNIYLLLPFVSRIFIFSHVQLPTSRSSTSRSSSLSNLISPP
jgi:hypothetical protein